MTDELKACPFCGGEPTVDSNGVVWCPCFHESVETWNKRSNKAKTLSEITGEIVIDAEMKAVGQAVLQELKRLQYRIAELEAERRWIPASERLPEDISNVLVLSRGEQLIGSYHSEYELWYVPFVDKPVITHWMPLPEPPEVAR